MAGPRRRPTPQVLFGLSRLLSVGDRQRMNQLLTSGDMGSGGYVEPSAVRYRANLLVLANVLGYLDLCAFVVFLVEVAPVVLSEEVAEGAASPVTRRALCTRGIVLTRNLHTL